MFAIEREEAVTHPATWGIATDRLYDRLARYAGDITDLESRANTRRIERDVCIRELLSRGESERRVAATARISGPAVHYIKERTDA